MPARHRPILVAALLVLALTAGMAPAPAQEPAAGGITGDGRPGGGDSEGSGGDSQGGDSGEPAALGATGGAPAPAATAGGLPRERVRRAQERLAAAGFDPGPVDGAMGPRTRAALRAFQEARGLDPTGEPDGSTLGELGVE